MCVYACYQIAPRVLEMYLHNNIYILKLQYSGYLDKYI